MIVAPGGDKGGQVAVVWVEGNAVISIPFIKDCFLGAMEDEPCLVKWGLGVMGLPGCMEVECLEANCLMRFAILLGADCHVLTPCDWFSYCETVADILVKTSPDIVSSSGVRQAGACDGQQGQPLGQPTVALMGCPSGKLYLTQLVFDAIL